MSNEVINPWQTFYDNSGIPLANGTISFFVNTTVVLGTIFSDEAQTVAQANPYTLDAFGRITGDVKYTGLRTLLIKTDLGATVRTIDNVATISNQLDISDKLNPPTLAAMTADTRFTADDVGVSVPTTKERSTDNGGGARYDIIAGIGTADGFNIIAHDTESISFVLRDSYPLNAKAYGVSKDNTDAGNVLALNACFASLPSFSAVAVSPHAGAVQLAAATDGAGAVAAYNFDTTGGEVLIDAVTEFSGDKSTLIRLTAGTTFIGARDRTTLSNQHITIRDMSIEKDSGLSITGTIGIDLLNCSYNNLINLRIRTFEKGIVAGGLSTDAINGGFYGNYFFNEIANCDWAIFTEHEFNSNKIIGGRYLSNKVGISLAGCSDNYISAAFEKTTLAIELGDGAKSNTISQCRFESCGRDQGGGGDVNLLTGGAIYMHPNSTFNTVLGGHYSGSGDKIIDEGFCNVKSGVTAPAGGVADGSSNNMWANPAMDVDSDADGLADGLSLTPTTGITATIDNINHRVGLGSQKIVVDATNTLRRDALATLPVQAGNTYTIGVLVETSVDAAWSLKVGLTATGTEFVNVPINETPSNGDGFNLIQLSFLADDTILAGQEFVHLNFFMNSGTVGTVAELAIDFIGFWQGCGGALARNNFTLDSQLVVDAPTANTKNGAMYYLPEIDRPAYVDSANALRNASGRKVVGTANNVDAASTTTLPAGRNCVVINTPGGAINVDNITIDDDAIVMLLVPSADVTITDAGNKRLNGAFVGGSNDILTLGAIGTVWYEISRSAN